jgi:hypothetical protein
MNVPTRLSEGLLKLIELNGIHEEQDLTLEAFAFGHIFIWQAIMFSQ